MVNRGHYFAVALSAALLFLPAQAGAHTGSGIQVAAPAPSTSFGPASCPGAPISPTHVITGQFDSSLQGSFVDIPFDVPAGTTAVRVKYCYDPPIGPFTKHTLDLGIYQPRRPPSRPWGRREFRGWGGSSHPDVIAVAGGLLDRGPVQAQPDRQRAREDDTGISSRTDTGGPVGSRARRRGRDHPGSRRRGRAGRVAGGDRAEQRSGERRRALPAGSLRPAAGQSESGLVRR